jgi:predicted RNase H-like nuclease (RuvC/YqgF family)
LSNALDLITEQENEIEKQGQKIENLNGLIDYADKEIRKLRAENEKLKAELGEIN